MLAVVTMSIMAKISQTHERFLMWISVGLITVIAFETLAVNTAMPTVVKSLDGQNLYALAMGVVMATQLMTTALAGPWSDHKSPQTCLYTGVVLFATGLVMCTAAQDMTFFVCGRAIQGLGGGLCVVPLYTLVGSSVRSSRQPAFFAAFAAAWVLPSLVGPAISGFIVEHASWRIVFGIVPLVLLLAAPSLISITRKIPHEASPADGSRIRLTIGCAIAAGIGAAALQVISGSQPESFGPTVYVAIAMLAVWTFAFARPLLPPGTSVARRGLPATVLLRGIINGTFIGVETFLPLLLQDIHGWRPFQAGLVLTVGSVTWALGSAVQGRLSGPVWRARIPMIGTALQTIGIALTIAGAFSEVSGLVILSAWTISGLGIGLNYPAMTVHGLAMSAPTNHGRTSSSLQIADTLGASLAVAAAGIIYAVILPAQSPAFAAAIGLMAVLIFSGFLMSGRTQPEVGSKEASRLEASFAEE